MSLYDIIHGRSSLAPLILCMLGTEQGRVPRFRDAYFDGEQLVIYTRTGGGNRDFYESLESCRAHYPECFAKGETPPVGPWNSDLRQLPGFVRDEDDSFDSTYALFYYDVPAQLSWFKPWAADKTEQAPAERWQEALTKLQTAPPDDPLIQRLVAVLRPLADAIDKGQTGIVEI